MADRKMTMTINELKEAIFEKNKTFAEIAREQGVSRQCVEFLAKRNFGLACGKAKKIAEETEAAMYHFFGNSHCLDTTAKHFGLHPSSLARRFQRAGFKYSNRRKWTQEDIETIKKMRAEGKKHREIAEYFNTTAANIITALYVRTEERKQTRLTGLPREEIMKQAKENEKQVKKLLKEGLTAEEISKQVGISIPRVYQIAKNVELEYKTGINERSTKEQAEATKKWIKFLKEEQGRSYQQISDDLGMNITQVYAVVKKIKKEEGSC